MPSVMPLLNGYSLTSPQGNPSFCSVLLVESGGERVVFDFGHVGRRRRLLEALAARGLEPGDVGKVVVSHGHWDHLQNADLFRDAEVFVHPAELRNLAAPPATDFGTPRWAAAILTGLKIRETGDGDEVVPGVSVIELPGHTPGSIGLVVAGDETTVLAADAVPTLAVLRSRRASGRRYDREQADASVERVARLADVVYPGHDHPIRALEYDGPAASLEFRAP
ncbi:MBL fold metallo-hydrolase [Kribbella sp. CA-247076]|uniref:MBL fold metallo-hydrolase n=1 Tax=Kribbella sp. CA-247076 TaxID=3239941 RepID=UPI003D9137BA